MKLEPDAVLPSFLPTRLFSQLLLLLLVSLPLSASRADEPDFGVALSASIFATFEASPTLVTSRPDLWGGGGNPILTTGVLATNSANEDFREIYQGVGESGTSLFEAEYDGYANLVSGILQVDVKAKDQNNASAAYWTVSGSAGYYEWIEFDGPTDASGNYVIGFTTNLGSFSAENMQPPGYTYLWKANAGTTLIAEPLEAGFSDLQLTTSVQLKEDCPTLAGPACVFIPRTTTASGQVTVPGSNPVLRLSHSLGVAVRSATGDAGGASLRMNLPPGVVSTSYHQVPEPGASLAAYAALCSLALLRRNL